MLGYIVGLVGCWIFSDGLYSIALYYNAQSFRVGEKQGWRKDHAIRAVRILCGISLMIIGGIL